VVTYLRTKVMMRLTKAHARGTSTRTLVADEMVDRQTKWPSTTWTIFISESSA